MTIPRVQRCPQSWRACSRLATSSAALPATIGARWPSMAPYNPMKKHMDKLDEWGASQSKKFTSSRDAGPGASMSERLNLARGKDDLWERTKTGTTTTDDETNIVPQRAGSSRVGALPPAPSSYVGGSKAAPPPPPPQRGAAPAPPARKGPAPPLPRRMDNEGGTDRPPPPYATPSSVAGASTSTAMPDYIEFSKFSEQDKQAFFLLLDEVSWRCRADM